MKISKKAPLRALLYATGLYATVYALTELRPQGMEGWATFVSVLTAGCFAVIGTFAQACNELHGREVRSVGLAVLRPSPKNATPTFVEPQLGAVSMSGFLGRRP